MQNEKSQERLKAEEAILGLQQAYLGVFIKDAPVVNDVLKDLAVFCRASDSTFNPDPRIHALLEGRREVWLHITKHLDLSSQALWELRTKTKY